MHYYMFFFSSLSLSTGLLSFFLLRLYKNGSMLCDSDNENSSSSTSNMSYRGSPQTSQSGPP